MVGALLTICLYILLCSGKDHLTFVCIEKRKTGDNIHQMVLIRFTTYRFESKKVTIHDIEITTSQVP